jgi:guanylate kinase
MTRLTVIAGPTAVGKGTVIKRLVEKYGDVWVSVSATTRPPRPDEVDGVDYLFVSEEEFGRMVEAGEFLEWAVVHGEHRYGTPRLAVEEHLAQGVPCILEIDLEGVRQVRQSMPEALFVFILPPSWEELVRRLKFRDTEDQEEKARRLRTARVEMGCANEFDEVVVNDDLEEAVDRVHSLVMGG